MVEGARRPRDDSVRNRVCIVEHAARRDPQNPEPVFFQIMIPQRIARPAVAHFMGNAVDLDRQPSGKTAEIDDVILTDWMLLAEFQAAWAGAQALPQEAFGGGHLPAQFSGAINYRALRRRRAPSTAFHAVPLPVPGRLGSLIGHPTFCAISIALPSGSW